MAGAHTVPSTPKHTGRVNEYMNEKNLMRKCHIYLQLSDKETGPCNAKWLVYGFRATKEIDICRVLYAPQIPSTFIS